MGAAGVVLALVGVAPDIRHPVCPDVVDGLLVVRAKWAPLHPARGPSGLICEDTGAHDLVERRDDVRVAGRKVPSTNA